VTLPAWISVLSLAEFNAAFKRSDLGVLALFIYSPLPDFDLLTRGHALSARMWLSSEKNRVNAIAAMAYLNTSRSNQF
jgi:hypothetical protein